MKKPPAVNAGSMADIAFLLLVFFMVTMTIESETGLIRKLPPDEEFTGQIKERNVLNVFVNDRDEIMTDSRLVNVDELQDIAKHFILNPNNESELPEKEEKDIPLIGKTKVSKQVISLQCGSKTSYERYVDVQDALAAAYESARDELAQRTFNLSYNELIEQKAVERIDAIRAVYPMRISEAEPIEL